MFELNTESVRRHWESVSPELGALFRSVEQAEDWTVDDHPQVAERLSRISGLLALPQAAARLNSAPSDDLAFFLVHVTTSKAFRVVSWLDERHEGLGTRLLSRLLEQDAMGVHANLREPVLARVLTQRLQVVQNTPYFQKLLDPAMLQEIERAIVAHREDKNEHEA